MTLQLRGITWDHPRGYAPLAATAEAFSRWRPDVRITWDRRSLHAFGDAPLEDLAGSYDLLVIDHPHVGTVAGDHFLVPLDRIGRDEELATLAACAVGHSHTSYQWEGRQLALAIDAAAHVAAWRPDRLAAPPTTWDEVLELARSGRVLWPLKPVDALMSFYSLAAGCGTPCAQNPDRFIDRGTGLQILERLRRFAGLVPPVCLQLNPIQVLESLSADDPYDYCPLLFGYVNYARAGFRRHVVRFAAMPSEERRSPAGGVLGGAGLAISRRCRHLDAALDYAFWVAGAECQRGLYFESGGQPAHAAAWDNEAINRQSGGFFRDTRASLENAYLRPRHAGYPTFQIEASRIVHEALAGRVRAEAALGHVQEAWSQSRERPSALTPGAMRPPYRTVRPEGRGGGRPAALRLDGTARR